MIEASQNFLNFRRNYELASWKFFFLILRLGINELEEVGVQKLCNISYLDSWTTSSQSFLVFTYFIMASRKEKDKGRYDDR